MIPLLCVGIFAITLFAIGALAFDAFKRWVFPEGDNPRN